MIRLLPKGTKAPIKPPRLHSIDVVRAYGAVLEDRQIGAGGTTSEDALPFDKAIIKAALVDVATAPGLEDTVVGQLKAGFLFLASFQIGGGCPSALSDLNPAKAQDMSREEIASFFQQWGANREAELGAVVERETKALEGEWDIRIRMSKALQDA